MKEDQKRLYGQHTQRQFRLSMDRGINPLAQLTKRPKELGSKIIHSKNVQKDIPLTLTLDSNNAKSNSQVSPTRNLFRHTKNSQPTQVNNALILHRFDELFANPESTLFSDFKLMFQPIRIQQIVAPTLFEEQKNRQKLLKSAFKRKIQQRDMTNSIGPNILKLRLNKIQMQASQPIQQVNFKLKSLNKDIKTHRTQSVKRSFNQRHLVKRKRKTSRLSILQTLNPHHKNTFTYEDLYGAILYLNGIPKQAQQKVRVDYFKVYVEEGNNGELVRQIVGKRTGWRVVQLPSIANFVWTQSFRPSHRTLYHTPRETQANSESIPVLQPPTEQMSPSEEIFVRQLRKLLPLSSSLEQYCYLDDCFPSTISCSSPTNTSTLNKPPLIGMNVEDIPSKETPRKQLLNNSFGHSSVIHNHFSNHHCISDKKNLLENLTKYYERSDRIPFEYLPQSYNVCAYLIGQEVSISLSQDNSNELLQTLNQGVWIVKPAENSNRGKGIIVCQDKNEIIQYIKKKFYKPKQVQSQQKKQVQMQLSGLKRAKFVVQRYITPMLYEGRKFDIRAFLLITTMEGIIPWQQNKQSSQSGVLRAYFYQQCYIRTSCKPFAMNSRNKYVHLTNDAIQVTSSQYGKYEQGNKISMQQMRLYLNSVFQSDRSASKDTLNSNDNDDIWAKIMQNMRDRAKDIAQCSKDKLRRERLRDSSRRKQSKQAKTARISKNANTNHFQLFGLDFMIDDCFKVWLIEVNTNPSLTNDCSKVLQKFIPKLIDNVITIAVEPLMRTLKHGEVQNKFQCIYESKCDY